MCNHQDSDFTATSKLTATGIHSHNEMEYPQLAVQLLPLDEGLNHMRLPFAYKLHILLGDMEANRCEHIISWVENGIAFQIHDRQQFEDRIQPRYFRQSKIASFIRQVRILRHGHCTATTYSWTNISISKKDALFALYDSATCMVSQKSRVGVVMARMFILTSARMIKRNP